MTDTAQSWTPDYPYYKLPDYIKPGQLITRIPKPGYDNRVLEVLEFIAKYPNAKHIVQVRRISTAETLKNVLRDYNPVIVSAAVDSGFHSPDGYFQSALRTTRVHLILMVTPLTSMGVNLDDIGLAMSSTYDMQHDNALQFAATARHPDTERMVHVRGGNMIDLANAYARKGIVPPEYLTGKNVVDRRDNA